MARDIIEAWIKNNTGMHGRPTPYYERKSKSDEFEEQLEHIEKRKRLVYNVWYLQLKDGKFSEEWMSIGEREVDDQDELFDLIERLEKKYGSSIRTSLVKKNW